ncbi:MAG: DUF3575 domain-containing protein [Hymenobacteraceae bacterium]|nr:DUF3575 domain-containing protein [Hymenobacteraceae bacterium]MDX5397177.1 DUF3575 domain-containing protein [Hymenobacteraceae bacterium]MDX5442462.1 DUF3575 domain-containing protein [Hymenobacteraceae bacterium]MDX5513253.1 DUF3575 domain-containing protein [Hymenobacteraceae bacterium]
MKKIIGAVALLLAVTNATLAQTGSDEQVMPKTQLLKLTPQQFIMKAFQVDYEIAFGNRHSIQFSPSITVRENDNNYKKVTGGGLEVIKKFYIGTQAQPLEGFYAGLSGSYHRYSVESNDDCFFDWQTGQEICNTGRKEKINRFGLNVIFGHQFIIHDVVAIDLFVGGGMRIADSDNPRNKNERFDRDIFDYDYTGVAPKIGVSVGLGF